MPPEAFVTISCQRARRKLQPGGSRCFSANRRRTCQRERSAVDRYYDPTTGQFISVDPLVASTLQAYSYVGNDPVNGTDPSGMCNAKCQKAEKAAERAAKAKAAADAARDKAQEAQAAADQAAAQAAQDQALASSLIAPSTESLMPGYPSPAQDAAAAPAATQNADNKATIAAVDQARATAAQINANTLTNQAVQTGRSAGIPACVTQSNDTGKSLCPYGSPEWAQEAINVIGDEAGMTILFDTSPLTWFVGLFLP